MLVPELHSIFCPDVFDGRLDGFRPDEPQDFRTEVCFRLKGAGETDHNGDLYSVTVCTLRWLQREIDEQGVVSGEDLLVVADRDLTKVRAYIETRVHRCAGDDWDEVDSQIRRWAHDHDQWW